MDTLTCDNNSPGLLKREPIAIVGMSCRFPGAQNLQAFWQLLREGRDAISEIPPQRFSLDQYYDERPGIPGKIISRYGGMLEEIDCFDATFFQVPPQEASWMDPQHRLLLEVAWEALEDAGFPPARVQEKQTGVFIGMWTNDYEDLQFRDLASISPYAVVTGVRSVAAGRLSHFLNAQGPSMVIDTACSSSLVAVHLACQSLQAGECQVALAGGVNLVLEPSQSISFSQAGMLSPDGRCKFGDARADGFVRSDGVGVVVLKPLAQALADHDPIYVVIRGSAVNNDGSAPGEQRRLSKPSLSGQRDVLRKAYRQAGIAPSQVSYVEVHGTGTSAGDPVELEALGDILAEGRAPDFPCLVGSVKTNIGHTEGAAGIAGLIKTALCLRHRTIVPTLHCHEPNPAISWSRVPFHLPQRVQPWESHPLYAGVSSFGISGTNAHLVLEEAPKQASPIAAEEPDAYLLPLSAHCPEALLELARRYESLLSETQLSLADVCYTASVHRAHHLYRLALAGTSRAELLDQLRAGPQTAAVQAPKVVFVFPGQGSQWPGMGRELLRQEQHFEQMIQRCEQAMRPYVDWSLREVLTTDEGAALLERIDVIQPTLFALEVALASLWRSWGIEPQAVIGHSMGEVAAAWVAGIVSLEDAARIICCRSKLMRGLGQHGAMLFVELSFAEAQSLLAENREQEVSLAACNGPRSVVLSGDRGALEAIMHIVEQRGIFCRFVRVDVASHSPAIDPVRDALLDALKELQPQPTRIPMFSTVTTDEDAPCDAAYWVRNIREPVLFAQTVQRLLEQEFTIFLEVSPHPILISSLRHCFEAAGKQAIAVGTLQRETPEPLALLQALGRLYERGCTPDWSCLYPQSRQRVSLPLYPWQHQRFWLPASARPLSLEGEAQQRFPFVQLHWPFALHPETHFLLTRLACQRFPYLRDHRIHTTMILPATAYIELALEAIRVIPGARHALLENLELLNALALSDDEPQTIQTILAPDGPGLFTLHMFRLTEDESHLHARGIVRLLQAAPQAPEVSLLELQQRCSGEVCTAETFYHDVGMRRANYGPAFRGVERLWKGDGEALALLQPSEAVKQGTQTYVLHPAWLDACLQTLFGTIPAMLDGKRIGARDTYVPVHIKRMSVYAALEAERYWSYARLQENSEADLLVGDVVVLDAQGQVLVELNGVLLRRSKQEAQQEYLYQLRWEEQPSAQTEATLSPLLLFANEDDETAKQLELALQERGQACIVVQPGANFQRLDAHRYQLDPALEADWEQFFTQIPGTNYTLLFLAGGSIEMDRPAEQLEDEYLTLCGRWLALVQALVKVPEPPFLWLVTRGAQVALAEQKTVNCVQAPLWGLCRVLRNEHPTIRCSILDLSPVPSVRELSMLLDEVSRCEAYQELALRGTTRYMHRLLREDALPVVAPRSVEEPDQFYLETTQPGSLDALRFRQAERRAPGPGEVEIQVHASALNFRDVLSALGMSPTSAQGVDPLGIECAGIITAVGPGIETVHVGAAVIALAPHAIGAYVTTDVRYVLPIPEPLCFEDAVTIPIAFLTASYALHTLGHMQPGERVLIHSAAGGVGLAAVQLAKLAGVEIFATAGTPEKRAYLQSLGVQHVMDSRSLEFAEEVMRLTNGEGVDLVLNALAGAYIQKGLSVLRLCGRFLELGKRDIYQGSQLSLAPFRNNLAYHAIDLDKLIKGRPGLIGGLLAAIGRKLDEGQITPLPYRSFALSDAEDAFRYMAQAKHIGKIVLTHQPQKARPKHVVSIPVIVRAQASYLITGGLGGIGLTMARWLVEQGARHLVLLGRKAPSAEVARFLETLSARGVQVRVAAVDVSCEEQLARELASIERTMPPLRGVLHAAAVLDDGMLMQQNPRRFQTVMRPKVRGAWNLHRQTLHHALDFFVLFSSAATLIAPPGQGNYVAANSFLDALAHYRRARGLPSLCINWGAWGEIGFLASRPELGRHFEGRGLIPLDPHEATELFGRLLLQRKPQLCVMAMDWERWQKFYPVSCEASLLRRLMPEEVRQAQTGEEQPFSWGEGPLAAQQARLEAYLQAQFAEIRGIERVSVQTPLLQQGLDSLMAVELRNRIQRDLGISLLVKHLLGKATIRQVAALLREAFQMTDKG
uniref:Polyketide synthase n=1 Tax=Thermosporothrix sp. COM3 TaxID=2490863 RepID=A0A455SGP3_9CHLR|nr:polyketide synthase [Thermosporothrix sp. COM3]